ncbi:MAG: AAA family ATPase [Acidobacteriaceae bacterium]
MGTPQTAPAALHGELSPGIRQAIARGWRLHPLRRRTKLPCLRGWQYHAASDLRQIETWTQQFPACNWGAVAGPDSGFFAVDVDDPDAMRRLEDEYGPVPEGLRNVTSQGYQLIYKWPPDADLRPATNWPRKGIDIRGRDSYIVIPPSVHPSGHMYRYLDDSLPIPACPPWLQALIVSHSQAPAQDRQSAPRRDITAGAPIGKGDRTNRLVSLAGIMNRRGMTHAAVEAALLAENAAKCSPPLPDEKVRAIARDIPARYPNPKSEPEVKPVLKPDLVCLADVEARAVDWLWEPLIPKGMLSMLSGDPGAGKSFIALALAADLSHGKLRDGRTVGPASTLYLSAENPIAQSIRPRFDELGGDAAHFHVLKGTLNSADGEEQHGGITLADISTLEAAISQTDARLVIVDPIQSYLGANVDLHRSNETRPVMDGLSKMAESCGCAILLLRHLSKQSGGKAIFRGLGSIDLTGAVRSEMLVGSLPDDPDARALVHVKSNVGPFSRALGYTIDGDGHFMWTGESRITAADLLAAPAGPADHKLAEASQWLAELLKQGSLEQKEVREQANGAGIAYATLRRAKNTLRVHSYKATMTGPWLWALPEDTHDFPEDAQKQSVSSFGNGRKSTAHDLSGNTRVDGLSPKVLKNPGKATMSIFEGACGGLLQ